MEASQFISVGDPKPEEVEKIFLTWSEVYEAKSATIILGNREVEENGRIQGGGKWKSWRSANLGVE